MWRRRRRRGRRRRRRWLGCRPSGRRGRRGHCGPGGGPRLGHHLPPRGRRWRRRGVEAALQTGGRARLRHARRPPVDGRGTVQAARRLVALRARRGRVRAGRPEPASPQQLVGGGRTRRRSRGSRAARGDGDRGHEPSRRRYRGRGTCIQRLPVVRYGDLRQPRPGVARAFAPAGKPPLGARMRGTPQVEGHGVARWGKLGFGPAALGDGADPRAGAPSPACHSRGPRRALPLPRPPRPGKGGGRSRPCCRT